MEMTFRIENGTLVTEATPQAESAGIVDGGKFEVVKTSKGLMLMSEEAARQFRIALRIMDENHEVLRKLAQ